MKQKVLDHFGNDFRPFFDRYLRNSKPAGSNGAEFLACCPFHDDHDPSLNFNAANGKYLCHGCGAKGDIFTFYSRQHNLNGDFPAVLKAMAEDFSIQGPYKKEKSKRKIAKVYDYHDATGNVVHQTVRFEPKSFSQRRPDGKGGYIWSLEGIDTYLYRLPDLLLRPNEVVLVPEGEKDADNLKALGFLATTNPMGSGKWLDTYSLQLEGREVVVLPDHDDGAGEKHLHKVAESLLRHSAVVRVLRVPNPEGKPKWDVSDWIETFSDPDEAAERLSILIDGAEPYQQPAQPSPTMTMADFSKIKIKSRPPLLSPWLKRGSITLVSGWRGVGKTWFGLGVIDALSSGGNFGPWTCDTPARCFYLDGEMSTEDDIERIKNIGLDDPDRPCAPLIYCDAYATSLGFPRVNLTEPESRDRLKEMLLEHRTELFVVDNIASLTPGLDENARQDWDPINQWFLSLRFAGISTLLKHHTNKEGGQRGTSAREDNVDASIILKAPGDYSPEDGARFIVHFTKSRVSNRYLDQVSDIEMQLALSAEGKYQWTYRNVKATNTAAALRMLDEGTKQADIAKALGVSKGQVCKIRSKAIREGHLTEKNKLTQSGFLNVSKH